MSRVGLSTIKIPDGVTVTFVDGELTAKGKNGELSIKTHNFISVDINNDEISFKTINKSKFGRSLWGTTRANVANVIKGVSQGFTKIMELSGVFRTSLNPFLIHSLTLEISFFNIKKGLFAFPKAYSLKSSLELSLIHI